MSDLFTEIILDEAKHPANFGTLEGADLKHVQYNPSCGDTVQVTIKLDEKNQLIEDLKWTGEGCTISMATMSLLSQQLIRKPVSAAQKLTHQDLLKLLDIPDITPGRMKCLMIGLKAVQDLLATVETR